MAKADVVANPTHLTQKAYLNALAALLDNGSRLLIGFVVTPFLLFGLGPILFGAWQILTRLVGNIGAFDGRPDQALKWVMTTHQDSEDDRRKRRVVGSAVTVWLIALPFLVVASAIVIWISPTVAGVAQEFAPIVRLTAGLLSIKVVLSGLATIPQAVLKGMNIGYKRMGLVASINIVAGGLTILALNLGYGILTVAGIQVLSTLTVGLLFLQLMRRYLPWFGVERASWAEVKTFFGLSIWYTVWGWVIKLLMSLDVILLGLLTSATLVTDFVLTSYIALSMVVIVGMMVGSSVPGLGNLLSRKQFDRVIDLRNEMIMLSILIALILGSSVLLWNQSFLALWVGIEHFAGTVANLLIVLIAVQMIFIRNETYMIDLMLDVRRKVLAGVAAIIITSLISLFLVPYWGIVGLCISVLVGRSCLMVAYPVITSEYLQVPLWLQIVSYIRPLGAMMFIFPVSLYLSPLLLVDSWISLIVGVGITLPTLTVVGLFTGFPAAQRRAFSLRLRTINPFSVNV
jgi:O-antigen/teichoic acid export membrane protein